MQLNVSTSCSDHPCQDPGRALGPCRLPHWLLALDQERPNDTKRRERGEAKGKGPCYRPKAQCNRILLLASLQLAWKIHQCRQCKKGMGYRIWAHRSQFLPIWWFTFLTDWTNSFDSSSKADNWNAGGEHVSALPFGHRSVNSQMPNVRVVCSHDGLGLDLGNADLYLPNKLYHASVPH